MPPLSSNINKSVRFDLMSTRVKSYIEDDDNYKNHNNDYGKNNYNHSNKVGFDLPFREALNQKRKQDRIMDHV